MNYYRSQTFLWGSTIIVTVALGLLMLAGSNGMNLETVIKVVITCILYMFWGWFIRGVEL